MYTRDGSRELHRRWRPRHQGLLLGQLRGRKVGLSTYLADGMKRLLNVGFFTYQARSRSTFLASNRTASQSPRLTASFGVNQLPPTQATLGSARYAGAVS